MVSKLLKVVKDKIKNDKNMIITAVISDGSYFTGTAIPVNADEENGINFECEHGLELHIDTQNHPLIDYDELEEEFYIKSDVAEYYIS